MNCFDAAGMSCRCIQFTRKDGKENCQHNHNPHDGDDLYGPG